MNQITEQIFLGDSQDAKDLSQLRANGIYNILNVAEDLPPVLGWKDGIRSFHIGLSDGVNSTEFYLASYHVLNTVTKDGKILVHCHEGKSRSAFVVAMHLCFVNRSENKSSNMFSQEMMDRYISFLKEKRPQVSINRGHYISLGLTQP